MNEKAARVQKFTQIIGEFVTEGLRGLRGEKAVWVNVAHERGTGTIRIVVDTNPTTVVAYLHPVDPTLTDMELFSVHDMESGDFH